MDHRLISIMGRGMIVGGLAVLLFPLLLLGYSAYFSKALQLQVESNYTPNQMKQKLEMENHGPIMNLNKDESTAVIDTTGLYPDSAPDLKASLVPGQIIGNISIPAIDIKQPFLEGTGQIELAKAPGHLSESVLPGQPGTSVIAAHNTTTFRHLDRLVEGTEFMVTTPQGVFTFKVTGSHILNVGEPLTNMGYPAIALETCYPLDAIYLTDKRFFVEAALVKSELFPRDSEKK